LLIDSQICGEIVQEVADVGRLLRFECFRLRRLCVHFWFLVCLFGLRLFIELVYEFIGFFLRYRPSVEVAKLVGGLGVCELPAPDGDNLPTTNEILAAGRLP